MDLDNIVERFGEFAGLPAVPQVVLLPDARSLLRDVLHVPDAP